MAEVRVDPANMLERAREFQRRGELFRAHDAAMQGLALDPGNIWLQHQVVLSLARAGATKVAQIRFLGFDLKHREEEDLAALGARLEKDLALAAVGDQRWQLARIAARSYRRIFERTRGYYPAINAASLSLFFADTEQMAELAEATLAELDEVAPQDAEEAYYAWASRAEAELLLGRRDEAEQALRKAIAANPGDLAARATTVRNLEFVSEELRIGQQWLDALRPPPVLHYAGHIVAAPGQPGRFPSGKAAEIKARIEREVARLEPSHAYGSLAAGADILFAEAVLAQGAALHVVLPVAREAFVSASVAPAGAAWPERFHRCLEAATTVIYGSDATVLDYDNLFAFGARFTMGLAVMRARALHAAVHQIAVWDGAPVAGPIGTAVEVAAWRALGLPQTIIPCADGMPIAAVTPATLVLPFPRKVAAMLCGDFPGYDRLNDDQLIAFVMHVLIKLRAVVAKHQPRLLQATFSGGSFFLVLPSAEDAAACALDLQDAMASVALPAVGLPSNLQMRIGGHYGPVFVGEGDVLGGHSVFGAEATRAMQIEPIAPGACVYVTASFAAQLALAARPLATTQYVGVSDGAGAHRPTDMFLLTRITAAEAARQESRLW